MAPLRQISFAHRAGDGDGAGDRFFLGAVRFRATSSSDRPTDHGCDAAGRPTILSVDLYVPSIVRTLRPASKRRKEVILLLLGFVRYSPTGCGVNMAPKTPPAKPSLHALARRARSDRHDKVRARRYQLDKESRYTDTASRRPNGTAPTGWMLIGCFLFFLSKKNTTHQLLPCWFFFLFLFNFFNTK
jgi:hypothetical protein